MLAFFLVCAIGALQIGAPRKTVLTTNTVNPAAQPVGGRSVVPASLALPMPMTPPMPVVHIVGRRMTSDEKRAAAASAG